MNTRKIKIYNREYLLGERTANDYIKLRELRKRNTSEFNLSLVSIADSLAVNYKSLKWFNVRKWILRRRFCIKQLSKELTPQRMNELIIEVYVLEGIPRVELENQMKEKKKVMKLQ
ncbi:MAG: hypothetical protein GY853_09580 [PVC group bacterium]|nr:hypothetical protein [PVC group bacterium]